MALPWVRSSGGTGEVQRPASLRFQPEAALISLGGAGLKYDASDTSNAAQKWRRQPIVQRALQIVSDLPFRYPNREIRYNLSDATGTISMRNLAWAYELAHGEVGIGPRVLDSGGGEQVQHAGVSMFGVQSSQSVTDSHTIHELLFRVKPGLIIELGTFCGGSAVQMAIAQQMYDPDGVLVTFDMRDATKAWDCIQPPGAKWAQSLTPFGLPGVQTPQWAALTRSGRLQPRVGNALLPVHLRFLREAAAKAKAADKAVLIIDDGNHMAGAIGRTFRGLSELVTNGSYYLVQDTRLDFECAYDTLTKGRPGWGYCRDILIEGGPAAALERIKQTKAFRKGAWVQDREVERWGITQHPGGYLRKGSPIVQWPPPLRSW